MEFISTQKFIRTSPRKVRLVVGMVKGLDPLRAIDVLSVVNKRAALPLSKVIKSAVANAKQKGIVDLRFKEIQVGEGPRLKRGRPVSKGRWHSIKKRMSHVRVVLEEIEAPKPKAGMKVKKVLKVKKQVGIKAKKGKNGTKS